MLHFLKTSFSLLFGVADLELASPELSGFYFNNWVRHDDINQVVFSLIMTKEFLSSFFPVIRPEGIDDNSSPNLQIPRWLASRSVVTVK